MAKLTPQRILDERRRCRRREVNTMLRAYGFVCLNHEDAEHARWQHESYKDLIFNVTGEVHGPNAHVEAGSQTALVRACLERDRQRAGEINRQNRELIEEMKTAPDVRQSPATHIPGGYEIEAQDNHVLLRDADYPELGIAIPRALPQQEIDRAIETLKSIRIEHEKKLNRLEEEFGFVHVAASNGNPSRLVNPGYGLDPIIIPCFDNAPDHPTKYLDALHQAEVAATEIQLRIMKLEENWKKLFLKFERVLQNPEDPDAGYKFVFSRAADPNESDTFKRLQLEDYQRQTKHSQRRNEQDQRKITGKGVIETISGERDYDHLEVPDYGLKAPIMPWPTLRRMEVNLQRRGMLLLSNLQKGILGEKFRITRSGDTIHYSAAATAIEFDIPADASLYDQLHIMLPNWNKHRRLDLYGDEYLRQFKSFGLDLQEMLVGAEYESRLRAKGVKADDVELAENGITAKVPDEVMRELDGKIVRYSDENLQIFADILGRYLSIKSDEVKALGFGIHSISEEKLALRHRQTGHEIIIPKYFVNRLNAPKLIEGFNEARNYAQNLEKPAEKSSIDPIAQIIDDYGYVIHEQQGKELRRVISSPIDGWRREVPSGEFVKGLQRYKEALADHTRNLDRHLQRQAAVLDALKAKGCSIEVEKGILYVTTSEIPQAKNFSLYGQKQLLDRASLNQLEEMLPIDVRADIKGKFATGKKK